MSCSMSKNTQQQNMYLMHNIQPDSYLIRNLETKAILLLLLESLWTVTANVVCKENEWSVFDSIAAYQRVLIFELFWLFCVFQVLHVSIVTKLQYRESRMQLWFMNLYKSTLQYIFFLFSLFGLSQPTVLIIIMIDFNYDWVIMIMIALLDHRVPLLQWQMFINRQYKQAQ